MARKFRRATFTDAWMESAGSLPRAHRAQVMDRRESLGPQYLGRPPTPSPALAIHDDRVVHGTDLIEAPGELIEGNVHRAGEMSGGELLLGADVEQARSVLDESMRLLARRTRRENDDAHE